jgi:4-hydroxybenzoate polyprenyltransferase
MSPATNHAAARRAIAAWPVLRIVVDVVAFRVRNLEMANLAGAASIALALHLPWSEVVYRTAFAFVLNVLVYLNNDWFDAADDLRAPGRNTAKTRYLARHMDAALAAQAALVALLVVAALAFDAGLLAALMFGGGTCVWYSRSLKRRPYVDVLAMAAWGIGMPMCGFPLDSALGWCLALQLGAFAAVYETIQVLRDAPDDAASGVRTTAVVLGTRGTQLLSRTLMLAASVLMALCLSPVAALVAAGALAVRLDGVDTERRWTQVKLVYAVAWLIVIASVWSSGASDGLLWSIASTAAGS